MSRWTLVMDEEGGTGRLSSGCDLDLDALIESDSVLALDVLHDWIISLSEKYDAAFHKTYPALGTPEPHNPD